MPLAETLQPEAGDDRNKEVEIAKLEEMYEAPPAPEPQFEIQPGPGDIIFKCADITGRLLVQRAHLRMR